jgi:hypothetical protein
MISALRNDTDGRSPFHIPPFDRSSTRYRTSWGVKIETGEIENFLGQEMIVGFSQAFLDWEEATEAKDERVVNRNMPDRSSFVYWLDESVF